MLVHYLYFLLELELKLFFCFFFFSNFKSGGGTYTNLQLVYVPASDPGEMAAHIV